MARQQLLINCSMPSLIVIRAWSPRRGASLYWPDWGLTQADITCEESADFGPGISASQTNKWLQWQQTRPRRILSRHILGNGRRKHQSATTSVRQAHCVQICSSVWVSFVLFQSRGIHQHSLMTRAMTDGQTDRRGNPFAEPYGRPRLKTQPDPEVLA